MAATDLVQADNSMLLVMLLHNTVKAEWSTLLLKEGLECAIGVLQAHALEIELFKFVGSLGGATSIVALVLTSDLVPIAVHYVLNETFNQYWLMSFIHAIYFAF
jgi:hypothetical protein